MNGGEKRPQAGCFPAAWLAEDNFRRHEGLRQAKSDLKLCGERLLAAKKLDDELEAAEAEEEEEGL